MASTITSEAQIIGTSSVLRDAVRRLAAVAHVHQLPVLIEGETGTGKELAGVRLGAPSQFRGLATL